MKLFIVKRIDWEYECTNSMLVRAATADDARRIAGERMGGLLAVAELSVEGEPGALEEWT